MDVASFGKAKARSLCDEAGKMNAANFGNSGEQPAELTRHSKLRYTKSGLPTRSSLSALRILPPIFLIR